MSRYDEIWASDMRRHHAQRGANTRHPDLTPPPARERSTPVWAVLALAAWPALLFVAWCVLP